MDRRHDLPLRLRSAPRNDAAAGGQAEVAGGGASPRPFPVSFGLGERWLPITFLAAPRRGPLVSRLSGTSRPRRPHGYRTETGPTRSPCSPERHVGLAWVRARRSRYPRVPVAGMQVADRLPGPRAGQRSHRAGQPGVGGSARAGAGLRLPCGGRSPPRPLHLLATSQHHRRRGRRCHPHHRRAVRGARRRHGRRCPRRSSGTCGCGLTHRRDCVVEPTGLAAAAVKGRSTHTLVASLPPESGSNGADHRTGLNTIAPAVPGRRVDRGPDDRHLSLEPATGLGRKLIAPVQVASMLLQYLLESEPHVRAPSFSTTAVRPIGSVSPSPVANSRSRTKSISGLSNVLGTASARCHSTV